MKKFFIFLSVTLLHSNLARPQGCVMVRNISGFGQYNLTDNAFSTSDWYLNFNTRYFKAWRDFRGTEDQKTPKQDQSIIRSFTLDIMVTKLFRNGWSMDLSLPVTANSRSATKEHGGAGTARHITHSFGVGDIRLTAYKWLLSPKVSQKGNIQLGLGIKFPTGSYKYEDYFYKNDTAKILAPVNASIALGDGGTGIITEVNGYFILSKSLSIYGNFYYVMNPRDINGVGTTTWRTPTSLQVATGGDVYSVPDIYSFRAGLNYNLPKVAFSAGLRDEGVPFKDLLGDNNGLRRTGHNLSIEPGVIYKMKNVSLYTYVPIIVARSIKQDPSDAKASEISGVYRTSTGGSGNYYVFVGALLKL
jgi:hypothetical protein